MRLEGAIPVRSYDKGIGHAVMPSANKLRKLCNNLSRANFTCIRRTFIINSLMERMPTGHPLTECTYGQCCRVQGQSSIHYKHGSKVDPLLRFASSTHGRNS